MNEVLTEGEDVAAIRKLADDWRAGWDRNDVEVILSLYADEPVLLPQGRPAVTEKSSIREMYRSLFEAYVVKGEGKIERIEASGDLGYIWSSYTLRAKPKGGGAQVTGEGRSGLLSGARGTGLGRSFY